MATTTILAASIVASTADSGPQSLSGAHQTAVRAVVGGFGARDVQHLGGAVVVLFDSAYDAVRAGCALLQRSVREAANDDDWASMRAGVAIGEETDSGDDGLRTAVALACAIFDVAEAGQILVSDIVEHLLRKRADVRFRDLGEVELPGHREAERIFEVEWEPAQVERMARIVVADDAGLLRAGIVNVLLMAGFDVVAEAGDLDGTIDAVDRHRPDLLVTDIRMPPTHTDEGIRAALAVRANHPDLAVLVLSQYVDAHAAISLLDSPGSGVGYLLKERVTEVAEFLDAVRQVLAGTPVIDVTVAHKMMARQSVDQALARLSAREREVLEQMATGASNRTIADALVVSAKTIETHVGSIMTKLGLTEVGDGNRRVQAVLTFLEATR